MKIGILCAGDDELAPFLPQIKEIKMTEKAMLKFYEGKLGGADVVALYSGVCKVNAAIATQILIDTFGVSAVINAGTAGAIDENLHIFDTVIATECCYHDVADDILTDFHPWMKSVFFESSPYLLEKAKLAVKKAGLSNVFFGRMATGEAFITDEGREQITRKFAPLSVDMETAAVAHVCYVNNIPFLSVRAITDTAAHSGIDSFEENSAKASGIAAELTMEVIKELSDFADTGLRG